MHVVPTMALAANFLPVRVFRAAKREARASELDRTHSAVFTYNPASGVTGVAAALASVLRGLPPFVRVHLVGHSLGGLAVRWFVQEMPSDTRVLQTISVAPPFEGARGARFFPGPAGRDMRRGSPTLVRLARTAGVPNLPHLSIFGTADTAVSAETAFPVGDREIVLGAGHNALLFDDGVADRIIERVSALRSRFS
jgi:hypothetical protein